MYRASHNIFLACVFQDSPTYIKTFYFAMSIFLKYAPVFKCSPISLYLPNNMNDGILKRDEI